MNTKDNDSQSQAALMIKRFRESKPMSRNERELNLKPNNKELWWIDNDIDSESPHQRSNVNIKPIKQSNISNSIYNKKTESPIILKSKEIPNYSKYINTNASINDSVDFTNKIEKRLEERKPIQVNNLTNSFDNDVDDFMIREIELLSKQGYKPKSNNINEKSSRLSLTNSNEFSWLYKRNDNTSNQVTNKQFSSQNDRTLKSLLDFDYKLDGSLDIDIKKPSIDNNIKPSNESLNEVTHNMEELINKLKKEGEALIKPSDLNKNLPSTIPLITKQLDCHMSQFISNINIKQENEDKELKDRILRDEQMKELGRKEEKVKQLFNHNWDLHLSNDPSVLSIKRSEILTTENMNNSRNETNTDSYVDKQIDKHLDNHIQLENTISHNPISQVNKILDSKISSDINPVVSNIDNRNKDINLLNKAYDIELSAANETFYKMKVFRQGITQRLNQLPNEISNNYQSIRSYNKQPIIVNSSHHTMKSLNETKDNIVMNLSDTILKLESQFPIDISENVIQTQDVSIQTSIIIDNIENVTAVKSDDKVDNRLDNYIPSNTTTNLNLKSNSSSRVVIDQLMNGNIRSKKKNATYIDINKELNKLDSILGIDDYYDYNLDNYVINNINKTNRDVRNTDANTIKPSKMHDPRKIIDNITYNDSTKENLPMFNNQPYVNSTIVPSNVYSRPIEGQAIKHLRESNQLIQQSNNLNNHNKNDYGIVNKQNDLSKYDDRYKYLQQMRTLRLNIIKS